MLFRSGPLNVLDLSCNLRPAFSHPSSLRDSFDDALNLDQLKGDDDETFRGTGRASRRNSEILRHLLLPRERQKLLAPEVIGRAISTMSSTPAVLHDILGIRTTWWHAWGPP